MVKRLWVCHTIRTIGITLAIKVELIPQEVQFGTQKLVVMRKHGLTSDTKDLSFIYLLHSLVISLLFKRRESISDSFKEPCTSNINV